MSEETKALEFQGIMEEAEEDIFHDVRTEQAMTKFTRCKEILLGLQYAYSIAKNAESGVDTHCAMCGTLFKKRHPQQAFCSNARSRGKGKKNCKDVYWNRVKGLKHTITMGE